MTDTHVETNAVALLKADHVKVLGLFKQFESSNSSDQKKDLVSDICDELAIHTQLEEEIFYPAVRKDADVLDRIAGFLGARAA